MCDYLLKNETNLFSHTICDSLKNISTTNFCSIDIHVLNIMFEVYFEVAHNLPPPHLETILG